MTSFTDVDQYYRRSNGDTKAEAYLAPPADGGVSPNQDEDERSVSTFSSKDIVPPVALRHHAGLISLLILLLGAAACVMLLGLGLSSIRKEQEQNFDTLASELKNQFERALNDYVRAGNWIHQACRERNMNHSRFRDLYDYINSDLDFEFIGWHPNVTHDEREAYENETAAFVEDISPIPYLGFRGIEWNETSQLYEGINPSPEREWYMPLHYIQPIERHSIYLDINTYESFLRPILDEALTTGKPSFSNRITYERTTTALSHPKGTYHISLFHPGVPLPSNPNKVVPTDLATVSFFLPDLLDRAYTSFTVDESVSIYIYDETDSVGPVPQFLAGVHVQDTLTVVPELEMGDLFEDDHLFEQVYALPIAARKWSFIVVSSEDKAKSDRAFVIFGAIMIFLACACLALWVYTSQKRSVEMQKLEAKGEADRLAMKVENAKTAAKAERELNDFIAHEVRNPLSAALSACNFVKVAVFETLPLATVESQKAVQEDLIIINNSLQFINDLLRNMLDLHRATSKQLTITLSPVDVLHDIFDPVSSMIYQRGGDFEVVKDCPKSLFVMSDGLRLKQIVLNLSRNSAKFVTKGFIRLRASIESGEVVLSVEDSGPGIPVSKRNCLFQKFQSSLDSLNQGTGIGLSLSKHLSEMMCADLLLDEAYDSGVEQYPGARFVINLHKKPLCVDAVTEERAEHLSTHSDPTEGETKDEVFHRLPENLSVLFVDDDLVVRKLFVRSVERVAPSWNVQEASNGETCLMVCEKQSFDLIFLDQYMASYDKQLLGTETARALRAKGVKSRICGLSANDQEQAFLKAGADCFLLKPFPCEQNALTNLIVNILNRGERFRTEDQAKRGDDGLHGQSCSIPY